jgi:hypothetical protein
MVVHQFFKLQFEIYCGSVRGGFRGERQVSNSDWPKIYFLISNSILNSFFLGFLILKFWHFLFKNHISVSVLTTPVNDRYNTCLSPRHLKFKFQRLLKKFFIGPKPRNFMGNPLSRAFRTRPFRRNRTQTEVRNSDSDFRNRDFPTPWPKIISQWNTYDVLTTVDICACGL